MKTIRKYIVTEALISISSVLFLFVVMMLNITEQLKKNLLEKVLLTIYLLDL